GFWCTPTMTTPHLTMAILITVYILIGIYYEEKDLVKVFGKSYKDYQQEVSMLIPLPKTSRKK
ncbi:MAG: hypothetical protein AAFU03_11400, partial [Bacteroidota bacterium]